MYWSGNAGAGSFLFVSASCLQVETTLRWGWDAHRFGNRRPQHEDPSGFDIQVIDTAISSAYFWGYLHMLETLTSMIQSALAWCEECPCHSELPRQSMPASSCRKWAQCPMRSCRAPELAAGGFMDVLRRVANSSAGHLLTKLPRDVSPVERAALFREYERGKAHLLFVLALRLDHWRHPPWSAFACAHLDSSISRRAVRKCLTVRATDHLSRQLQSGGVCLEAVRYTEDAADLGDLPALSAFLTKLLFCPVAERRVEGDHAQADFGVCLCWCVCVCQCLLLWVSPCARLFTC